MRRALIIIRTIIFRFNYEKSSNNYPYNYLGLIMRSALIIIRTIRLLKFLTSE